MRTNRSIQEYCEIVDSDVSKIKLAIDHIEQARVALHDVNMKHILSNLRHLRRLDVVCGADLSLSHCQSELEIALKFVEIRVNNAKGWNKFRKSLKERKFSQGKQG